MSKHIKDLQRELWHADSHPLTKNEDGTPKTFYHGTGRDFKKFLTKPGETTEGAAFFTSHPTVASGFARTQGEVEEDATPVVYPVHVHMKNPKVLNHTDVMKWHEHSSSWLHSFDAMSSAVQKARDEGHDGLYIKKVPEYDDEAPPSDQVAVFKPNQIKSVYNPAPNKCNHNISEAKQGELFRPSQKEAKAQNFKSWFGDSKAVGKNGKPQKMYHTTRSGDFHTFEVGRTTKNSGTFGDWETQRHAIFVTPHRKNSETYGKVGDRFKTGVAVMPMHVSAQNPLDLRDGAQHTYELSDKLKEHGVNPVWLRHFDWGHFDGEEGKHFVEAAKKLGHDSVIFHEQDPDTGKQFETWALFHPHQVKSVWNHGTYKSDSGNISESFDDKRNFETRQEVTTHKGVKVELHHKHQFQPANSTPDDPEEYSWGRVKAYIGGKEVGELPYGRNHVDTGILQVGDMYVHPKHQRKGIGTAMFNFVRQNGFDLHHYPNEGDMTPAGRAFARATPLKEAFYTEDEARAAFKKAYPDGWKMDKNRTGETPWKDDVHSADVIRHFGEDGSKTFIYGNHIPELNQFEVEYAEVHGDHGKGTYTNVLDKLRRHMTVVSDLPGNNAAKGAYKKLGAREDRNGRFILDHKKDLIESLQHFVAPGVNGHIDTGDWGTAIYEWSGDGTGKTRDALRSLNRPIHVIDPGDPGTPSHNYWKKMHAEGLVDHLCDADGRKLTESKNTSPLNKKNFEESMSKLTLTQVETKKKQAELLESVKDKELIEAVAIVLDSGLFEATILESMYDDKLVSPFAMDRLYIATHGNDAHRDQLLKDEDAMVRFGVAQRGHLSHLNALATDPHPMVRDQVARRGDEELAKKLSEDPHATVRSSAFNRLAELAAAEKAKHDAMTEAAKDPEHYETGTEIRLVEDGRFGKVKAWFESKKQGVFYVVGFPDGKTDMLQESAVESLDEGLCAPGELCVFPHPDNSGDLTHGTVLAHKDDGKVLVRHSSGEMSLDPDSVKKPSPEQLSRIRQFEDRENEHDANLSLTDNAGSASGKRFKLKRGEKVISGHDSEHEAMSAYKSMPDNKGVKIHAESWIDPSLDSLEEGILGQGMSKAARAADVDQSDREYIAQRQKKERVAKGESIGATHFSNALGDATKFFKQENDGWYMHDGEKWIKGGPHEHAQWKPVPLKEDREIYGGSYGFGKPIPEGSDSHQHVSDLMDQMKKHGLTEDFTVDGLGLTLKPEQLDQYDAEKAYANECPFCSGDDHANATDEEHQAAMNYHTQAAKAAPTLAEKHFQSRQYMRHQAKLKGIV